MNIKIIVREIFYILTLAMAFLTMLELFWPRVVLSYFNVNIVLILWVIAVMILLLIKEGNKK